MTVLPVGTDQAPAVLGGVPDRPDAGTANGFASMLGEPRVHTVQAPIFFGTPPVFPLLEAPPVIVPRVMPRVAPETLGPKSQPVPPQTRPPLPLDATPQAEQDPGNRIDHTIDRPEDPGGGQCACNCRAGDSNRPETYRFARWTAPTCADAAKMACRIASERAGVSHQHHSQAKCSDGSNRNAGGGLAR